MVLFTRRRVLGSALSALPAIGWTASRRELVVGAASNLTAVFQTIGPAFESATGIHPVFSFGSTAQLAQQIAERAPIDLFAAADTSHIADLDRRGMLATGSRAVYATGILALWIPSSSRAKIGRIEDLAKADVQIVAAAKPELAPYGLAAVEAMRKVGIWEAVKPKMVYAPNVSMVQQYGVSGNADAVFTAFSLARNALGTTLQIDARLHHRLDQELAIPASAANMESAREFRKFLLQGGGRRILADSGYLVPGIR